MLVKDEVRERAMRIARGDFDVLTKVTTEFVNRNLQKQDPEQSYPRKHEDKED